MNSTASELADAETHKTSRRYGLHEAYMALSTFVVTNYFCYQDLGLHECESQQLTDVSATAKELSSQFAPLDEAARGRVYS